MATSTDTAKRKKKRKKIPAVTQRELEFLARMRRNLYRIEESNLELRRKMGLPDGD